MTRNKRKDSTPTPRDDTESEWEQLPDNGKEHTAQVPAPQEQHLHNIISYWKLEKISEMLPFEFRHSTNDDLEPPTLRLLFKIAKCKPGIDGRHQASRLIASCWNSRSPWSQDHPTGRDDSRQREVYLRQDLDAVLGHIKKVDELGSKSAGKAAADLQSTERTVKIPTADNPAPRVPKTKRAMEDADAEKNAKRHKSTSPPGNEVDTEQSDDDMTNFDKNRLLNTIKDQWEMSALQVVPDNIQAELSLAKRDPLTWSMEALQGLRNIMKKSKDRTDPVEPNQLRCVLGDAYHARVKRPGEIRELIAEDTENVIRWMNGAKFYFDAPGIGLHGATDLQVFAMASSAPTTGIANNTSTGNAVSNSQELVISSSDSDREDDDSPEAEHASTSNHKNASQTPNGDAGCSGASDSQHVAPARPISPFSVAEGDKAPDAPHAPPAHGVTPSVGNGRGGSAVALEPPPSVSRELARSPATGHDGRLATEEVTQASATTARGVSPTRHGGNRAAETQARSLNDLKREWEREEVQLQLAKIEIQQVLCELRADVVAAQLDHDELSTPQSAAQLKIAKLRLKGKEEEYKSIAPRRRLMELEWKAKDPTRSRSQ